MNSDAARVQMVSQQVRTWDVLDPRVLDTMGLIDRQFFVPEAFASVAFADGRIPLAHDQVMLSPKVVGRALQALDIAPSDSVLGAIASSVMWGMTNCWGAMAKID